MNPPPAHTGLHFDDVAVGTTRETSTRTVHEDEMVLFAREWDPHPYHVDPVAAEQSVFGQLCASGLQTLAFTYRLFMDLGMFRGTTLAGLGCDEMRFFAPLFPGDTIRVRAEVIEATSTRKPDRGLLKVRLTTRNQSGMDVFQVVLTMLIQRRSSQPSVVSAQSGR